jgi:hypothetical protein
LAGVENAAACQSLPTASQAADGAAIAGACSASNPRVPKITLRIIRLSTLAQQGAESAELLDQKTIKNRSDYSDGLVKFT